MAERVTKSYADKIDELNQKIEKLQQNASAFYPQAGEVLFIILDADDVEELKKKWNSLAPKEMKVDEINCDAKMPTIDPTLARKNQKKFDELVEKCRIVRDMQNAAVGEAISNVLHVSVLGDLKNKLRELGILNDGVTGEVKESEEETLEDVNLEDVLAQEQAEQQSEATDSSTWNPYA